MLKGLKQNADTLRNFNLTAAVNMTHTAQQRPAWCMGVVLMLICCCMSNVECCQLWDAVHGDCAELDTHSARQFLASSLGAKCQYKHAPQLATPSLSAAQPPHNATMVAHYAVTRHGTRTPSPSVHENLAALHKFALAQLCPLVQSGAQHSNRGWLQAACAWEPRFDASEDKLLTPVGRVSN